MRRCSATRAGAVLGRLGLLAEHADEIAPAALRLVARRQRRERVGVVGPQREHAEVRVDDHDVEVQAVSIDRDDLEETADLFVDVVGRQRVELLLEDLEQRVPLLRLRVERLERRDGLGQPRLEAQQALPQLDGLVGALRARLGGARHLHAHGDAAIDVGLALLRLREDLQQVGLVVLRAVVGPVELDHLVVRGIDLADAAEEGLGRLGVVEPLPQQRREVDLQRDVLLAALRARRRLEDLGELGPASCCFGQRVAHGAQRARLVRARLERLAEVRERLVALADLRRHLAREHLGERAVLAVARRLGALACRASAARRSATCSRRRRSRCAPERRLPRVELHALAQVRLALGGARRRRRT